MKKIILFLIGGLFTLTACKKDYVCTYNLAGLEATVSYNDLDKDAAEEAKAACKALSGTWTTK